MLIEPIYEAEFANFSYGYRPGRSPLQAVGALAKALTTKRIGFVLDADISAFFDSVDHAKMIGFLEKKMGDRRLLQIIASWLGAGVMTEAGYEESAQGTPQGGIISPLLANVYLHYVLDVFVSRWRKSSAAGGEIIFVRYADDFVAGAQKEGDLLRLREALHERLAAHGLGLHPEKTRVMGFGRLSHRRRRRAGIQGQPETFDFLGFTHVSHQDGSGRKWHLLHITAKKKRNAKLKAIREELRRRRHLPVVEQHRWLCSVLEGHTNYYGVQGNWRKLNAFRWEVCRAWCRSLERRSQRARWTDHQRYRFLLRFPLPQMKIVHSFTAVP
jgi:group II intron reverse transcriptase/maturase